MTAPEVCIDTPITANGNENRCLKCRNLRENPRFSAWQGGNAACGVCRSGIIRANRNTVHVGHVIDRTCAKRLASPARQPGRSRGAPGQNYPHHPSPQVIPRFPPQAVANADGSSLCSSRLLAGRGAARMVKLRPRRDTGMLAGRFPPFYTSSSSDGWREAGGHSARAG